MCPSLRSWKGTIAPGQVRDDLVDVSDLFPTMLEAGRSTILNVQTDGVSLYPTLTRGVTFATEMDLHRLLSRPDIRAQHRP